MSEVLIIIIIYLIAKLSLDILQIQTIKTVPIDQQSIDLLGINSNEEYKSRRYNIEKLKISILRNVVYVGWIIYLLSGGLVIEINSYLESFLLNEYLHNLGVILVVFIVVHLSMLPLSYFSTFVIEDKYGFNTSTKRLFFRDNLVSLLMALILITVMSSVFFYLVSFTEIWWLLLASTMFIFIILEFVCSPSVSIGICQFNQDCALIFIFIKAPASKAQVTCSPVASKTSSSLLLKSFVID